jgi:hypothetical protein
MEFTRPEAYARQIALYLRERLDQNAYELSKDFVRAFPGELLAHVLLAESAFRLGRYPEAKVEARKAMAFASTETDLVFCATVFSSACFHLKDYIEGYNTLKEASAGRFILHIEEALFVLSLAMHDEDKAIRHMRNLTVLNRSRAADMMKTYLENAVGAGKPL